MRIEFVEGPRKGEVEDVTADKVVIGRDSKADVTVNDDEVSREHAELTLAGGAVTVRDLGSQNGTKVGRSKVSGDREVSSSDKIKIGNTVFTVDAGDAGDTGATRIAGSTRVAGGTRGGGGTRLASGVPAMVEVVAGPAKGKTFEVTSAGSSVGRESSADVQLDDDEISREHVTLRTKDDGTVEVEDLGSRNGTSVDGKRISRPVTVSDGAEISIGRSRLKVSTTARKTSRLPAVAASPSRPSAGVIAGVIGGLAALVILLLATGVLGGGDDEEKTLTTPEIVEEVGPSTLKILAKAGPRTISTGTGWVLDAEEGLVVTNAHVVESGEASLASLQALGRPINNFQVVVDQLPRRATVWAVAPCEDLAMLRLGGLADLPSVPLGSQEDVTAGQKAVALGYPGNLTAAADDLQTTEGTVSIAQTGADALELTLSGDYALLTDMIQTDAAINHGNSGGPLVNDKGDLIGVNTLGNPEAEAQGYAIGVDRVKEVTDQMRGGDSIGFAGIGFIGGANDIPGLFVTNVAPESGAEIGGLTIGDVIVELNGRPVETRIDYCNATENLTSGESAAVDYVNLFTGQQGHTRITFE